MEGCMDIMCKLQCAVCTTQCVLCSVQQTLCKGAVCKGLMVQYVRCSVQGWMRQVQVSRQGSEIGLVKGGRIIAAQITLIIKQPMQCTAAVNYKDANYTDDDLPTCICIINEMHKRQLYRKCAANYDGN